MKTSSPRTSAQTSSGVGNQSALSVSVYRERVGGNDRKEVLRGARCVCVYVYLFYVHSVRTKNIHKVIAAHEVSSQWAAVSRAHKC